MFSNSWWQKLTGKVAPKPIRRKAGQSTRRMEVEQLENRWLPSTFTVNSLADNTTAGDGLTTLREAVALANATTAPDTILLANATYKLELGQLNLTTSMTIRNKFGGVNFSTIDAQDNSRIFEVANGKVVVLDHLILTNGNHTGESRENEGVGGAIYNRGDLTLNYCQLINNEANGYSGAEGGPGEAYGGAIFTANVGNKLTIKNSTFDGNIARGGTMLGRFQNNGAGAEGGAICFGDGYDSEAGTGSTHSITASTFVNNQAIGGESAHYYSYGGEGYGGSYGGSTIYHDYSDGGNAYGGALAISHNGNTVKIVNSTFAYNAAYGGNSFAYGGYGGNAYGGAIASQKSTFFGDDRHNTVTLVNNTIAYNQVFGGEGDPYSGYGGSGNAYGGGVANLNQFSSFGVQVGVASSNVMNVINTIIAQNYSNQAFQAGALNHTGSDDVFGEFNSLGHNLIGNTDGSFGWLVGGTDGDVDLVGSSSSPLDPGLESDLKSNGANAAVPKTLALLYTSPALNAGDNVVTTSGPLMTELGVAKLTTDERGGNFKRKVTTTVDIGAFEVQINLDKFYAFRSRGVTTTFTIPAPGLLLGAPPLPGQYWQIALFGEAPDPMRTTLVVNPDGSFSFTVPPRYRNTVKFQFQLFIGNLQEASVNGVNTLGIALGTPTNFVFTATIQVTPLGGRGSAGAFLGLGLG